MHLLPKQYICWRAFVSFILKSLGIITHLIFVTTPTDYHVITVISAIHMALFAKACHV